MGWIVGGSAPSPDGERGGPGVDLDSYGVSALYEVRQRVKVGIGIRGPRIDCGGIECVPAAAYLDDQGVEIARLGCFDQLLYLLPGLDAGAVGIYPQGAELVRARGSRGEQAHIVYK